MSNAWDHLPNARYIDLAIESVKANPNEWITAYNAVWKEPKWDATWDAARDASINATSGVERDAAHDAAWRAATGATGGAPWWPARYAVSWVMLTLIFHDDCAHMLDSEPDELRILSRLGSYAATLLIPASIAFKLIREKQVAVL